VNVFYRDIFAVQTCDLFVADVTAPSTGVGMEIMAAYLAGKKIVLLAKRGVPLSRLLLDMESAERIDYDDNASLEVSLRSYFAKPVRKELRTNLIHAPGVSLR